MARRRRATLEWSRRQVAGLAADGLPWSDFAAASREVINHMIPHDAAVLSLVDPVSGILTDTFRTGLDDSLDELFIRLELTHPDPITMTTLTGRRDGVGILADHVPGGPHSTPRVRELLAPHFDLEHEMRSVVRSGGSMVAACGLYRAPHRPGFTVDEAASLSALEDVLAAGVRRSAAAAAGVAGARSGVDEAEASVLVLDAEGRASGITTTAQAYLEQLGGGEGGALPAPVRMVAEASRLRQAGHAVSPFVRARTRTGRWLMLRAAPLSGDPGPSRTVVTVEPASAEHTIDLDLDLYDVTPRERMVVREVVAGAGTTAIAGRLAISAYTVQDHLKSAFRKVGVSSRRELVHVLTHHDARGAAFGPIATVRQEMLRSRT
ncbi:helix-turn-helix transcriptional regulator [uncultured Serinicoccus sp.]|uniref:helix-turn-helix transcriptional regulator n=1 Tax=uncultured Serinicoccus sp. TaxID=735514 RepID=UPI00261E62B8|nr:helix-turn-helix transcriptional regulator [uncultured Serinicoccus sp.]